MLVRTLGRRNLALTIFVVTALWVSGCGENTVAPEEAMSEDIVVTAGPHHLGDNAGAEGVDFESTFEVTAPFDSASVSITFLVPNSFDVSGPEVEASPKIFVNTVEIGLTAADFPDAACISQDGEYACDITISMAASSVVNVGTNSIRVSNNALKGGRDDFLFSDLIVAIAR
jgi:hypothetical protein